MNTEFTRTPSSQDVDFLMTKINEATLEFGEAHTFGFFVRNDQGEIIAGCNGFVGYEASYTDQLWVHSDYRKEGLGKHIDPCH